MNFGVRAAALVAMCGVVTFLLAALGGCGGSSPSASTDSTDGYVTQSAVAGTKPGTPQRTALQWWRAVQFANAALARGFYAEAARPPLDDMQRQLAIASRQFVGVPRFDSAAVDGSDATLYFFVGRPGSEAAPQALSVNLVRADGRWRLADDQLLAQEVERAEKAAASRGD